MENTPTYNQNRNVTLDLLKLVAAYFVVLIHFPFPDPIGGIIRDIARFSVPLFFLVSGYYAYTNTPEKILKKLVHVLKLYLLAVVVYLVFRFLSAVYCEGNFGAGIFYLKGYFYNCNIPKFFFFNVTRSSGHLWFMPALIYTYAIFYLVRKKKFSEKLLFLLAGILLISCFLLEEGLAIFGEAISNIFTRNYLFTGVPYFCLGLLIFKHRETMVSCPGWLLILLIVFGSAESALSGGLIGKNEIYIGSAIAAVSVLILGLKGQVRSFSPFLVHLSEIGTPLYLWHCLIGEGLVLSGLNRFLNQIPYWDVFNPIVTCVLSTLLALFIHKLTQKGALLCEKQLKS